MLLQNLPFLLHILIETPAALTFILSPSSHLQPCPPQAALLIQSLGGLLLTSNLIALVFARREYDSTSRLVALALAFWHLWPCYRAVVRLRGHVDAQIEAEAEDVAKTKEDETRRTLGGPVVHLTVHALLLVMFLGTFLSRIQSL